MIASHSEKVQTHTITSDLSIGEGLSCSTHDGHAQLLAERLGLGPLEHAVLETPLLGHAALRALLQ
jgi:hypothetical protein